MDADGVHFRGLIVYARDSPKSAFRPVSGPFETLDGARAYLELYKKTFPGVEVRVVEARTKRNRL